MWSPKFQKNIFIDFGLTMLINEKVGQKTFTHYFGTYGYSSPEMKAIFNEASINYIDLYYNDLHGLKMSLQKIAKVGELKMKKTMDFSK